MAFPDYTESMKLLKDHVQLPHLITHGIAVSAVMKYFAHIHNENEDFWRCIGLCHDIDYEKHPDEHLLHTEGILKDAGWPENAIRAVLSHGWEICTEVQPILLMEKILFTIDELSGLVIASALVRPSRSLRDLGVSSVVKKWKQKGFAAGVNRDIIDKGIAMLDMDRNSLISHVIESLKPVSHEIGLEE